ncbi:hypothetical protein NDU88_007384 [Pleurodeles waltl]|uniref:Uncharacterized protein n=1 Tax=Pleurodeles waltl TaxID=8319 RepID=A0AAV7SSM3_PLEWA|nr:hypothetical protein NDU88_007384 [Pleurodeles waltl]
MLQHHGPGRSCPSSAAGRMAPVGGPGGRVGPQKMAAEEEKQPIDTGLLLMLQQRGAVQLELPALNAVLAVTIHGSDKVIDGTSGAFLQQTMGLIGNEGLDYSLANCEKPDFILGHYV